MRTQVWRSCPSTPNQDGNCLFKWKTIMKTSKTSNEGFKENTYEDIADQPLLLCPHSAGSCTSRTATSVSALFIHRACLVMTIPMGEKVLHASNHLITGHQGLSLLNTCYAFSFNLYCIQFLTLGTCVLHGICTVLELELYFSHVFAPNFELCMELAHFRS